MQLRDELRKFLAFQHINNTVVACRGTIAACACNYTGNPLKSRPGYLSDVAPRRFVTRHTLDVSGSNF
jgi:hypothetical protein